MNNNQLTKERLQEIAEDGFLKHGESKELARMALAAMDSEPFAYIIHDKYERERGVEGHLSRSHVSKYISQDDINEHEITCTPLYRHAQPAPVSYSDFEEFWSAYIHPLAQDDELKDFSWGIWNACASNSQPAPVVQCPFPCGWDNLNKLAIHDAALVARGLVEGELTTEAHRQAAISNNDRLLKVISACRAAMLASAPHDTPALNSVQSVVTMPGKWIPVSEQKPDCWCLTCRPVTLNDMRFVVCPDCGNKRCPRANDHRNACTGSNEPGQEGSAYPAAPKEVRGE